MVKKKYKCLDCGAEFIVDILEPGEAEEMMRRDPRMRPVPPTCSRCKRGNVRQTS